MEKEKTLTINQQKKLLEILVWNLYILMDTDHFANGKKENIIHIIDWMKLRELHENLETALIHLKGTNP